MAKAIIEAQSGCANLSRFDPAAWLSEFFALGGSLSVSSDSLSVCSPLDRHAADACDHMRTLEQGDSRSRLRAHVHSALTEMRR